MCGNKNLDIEAQKQGEEIPLLPKLESKDQKKFKCNIVDKILGFLFILYYIVIRIFLLPLLHFYSVIWNAIKLTYVECRWNLVCIFSLFFQSLLKRQTGNEKCVGT